MPWYVGVAGFFGGVFVANAIPHLVAGISGKPLPSPFASPPFRGLSSPVVNVAWGLTNLAVAYLLLVHVADLDVHDAGDAVLAFSGFALMALQCARAFARVQLP